MYRPTEASQMTTACRLQTPTTSTEYGVKVNSYKDVDGLIRANWKSYGGTEITSNDVLSIEDTATLVTWYRPDIKANCRIVRMSDGAVYEIMGEPENIEMRNQFLRFKVRRVKGGA